MCVASIRSEGGGLVSLCGVSICIFLLVFFFFVFHFFPRSFLSLLLEYRVSPLLCRYLCILSFASSVYCRNTSTSLPSIGDSLVSYIQGFLSFLLLFFSSFILLSAILGDQCFIYVCSGRDKNETQRRDSTPHEKGPQALHCCKETPGKIACTHARLYGERKGWLESP